ncbi:MAG: hypothetical protein P8J01_07510 [Acidimicrobiales bacterium]|jgi:hypothetical protein|nr:hypothetical protein [Acidimicrobiales bacterium]MDG1489377.1 hypothetical protein [Actinomycetota bacterium]MDG1846229.1 hypothetical protein [Acidimicrobiales bacterium]
MFLGENLIVLLALAFGGALAVGNFMALVNTRGAPKDSDYERPPLGRTVVMIVVGLVVSLWAIVSLISS